MFKSYLPKTSIFKDALYTVEIGGNDVLQSLESNKTAEEIIGVVIPQAMQNFANATQRLYGQGARRFLLFNLPPAGCATVIITSLAPLGLPLDSMGCVTAVNQLDQVYNSALAQTVEGLRAALPDATISIFDYYRANIEILTNPAKYGTTTGFNPNKTLIACCGTGGPYNYFNPLFPCGRPGATKCSNPDEYVNWDGVHFTESFYRIISKWALDGKFTDVPVNYTKNCCLSFSRFGSQVTYDQVPVYGGKCNVQFT